MLLQWLLTAALFFGGVSGTFQLFTVQESAWSSCKPINESQACYRTRDAACVHTTENVTVPWYYCTDAGRLRPSSVEMCPDGACIQECIVTEWSPWSECNCEAGFYRTRTRDVVVPPRNTEEPCPALLERELCSSCINNAAFDSLPRRYTWRTAAWGTCVALNNNCGAGLQNRTVQCIDSDGSEAMFSDCLLELAYSNLVSPPSTRLCTVPCNCEVSEWSEWSPCESVCTTPIPHIVQTRTRTITQQSTPDGNGCPVLIETRDCTDNAPLNCPTHYWSVSDWSTCQYQTNAACGFGHQTRYIYCIRETNGTIEHVNHTFCDASNRPVEFKSCHTPCPSVCIVGEWSPWSECTPSCEPSYRNRTRDILVEPRGDELCPHTLEIRECPQLPACLQWITEEYSVCIVSTGEDCGAGTQSRNAYCADERGNPLPSYECQDLPSPTRSQACYTPCPTDCVVSDWTPWTECSHTCGESNGTQTRTRHLIAFGINCTYSESDFVETRSCMLPEACELPSYHIEVGMWSLCRELPMSSGDSSDLVQFDERFPGCVIGVRNRTNYCVSNGQVVSETDCLIVFNSMEEEACSLSCDPQDCVYSMWSDYTECSATCGVGQRVQSRSLLRYPDDPQRLCRVDAAGLQYETEDCFVSDCVSAVYVWASDQWSECGLFSSNQPTTCGLGYQMRAVLCVNSVTQEVVDDVLCSSLPRPLSAQHCTIPCPNRCILTHWADYSLCENGAQYRNREIIPFIDSDDWMASCPELATLQLEERIQCTQINLNLFDYIVLDSFSDTIFSDPYAVCGNGDQYRTVACINMLSFELHDKEVCSHKTIGEDKVEVRPSSVKCETDCVQSDWSAWSPCSATCGYGTRTRSRTVVTQPLPSGRPCGHAQEQDVCYTLPCRYPEYRPGPFSTCQVSNTSLQCGPGTRTREPICFVNNVQQEDNSECNGISVNFERSESCDMPCPGECVTSEWSEWSECPEDITLGVHQQFRTRQILRNGPNLEYCMTQQVRECITENCYSWTVRYWGDCILPLNNEEVTPSDYCGEGVQRGVVECTHMGEVVFDGFCSNPKPASIRSCNISCPVDCVVGPFSEWSICPEQCEITLAEQTRTRSVVIPSSNSGRECPPLVQMRSCPPVCTEYVIESGRSNCDWDLTNRDFMDPAQCGTVDESHPLTCRKNARYMDLSVCTGAVEDGLSVIGAELLSNEPTNCQQSCPITSDCTYADPTPWSDCVSLCVDRNVRFQFRTKALLFSRSAELSCKAMQYEVSECPTLEPRNSTDLISFDSGIENCIGFEWLASEFDSNGRRDVVCVTNSSVMVSGGCPLATRPSSSLLPCEGVTCPAYSQCVGGVCECESEELEMVKGSCLPLSGCKDDNHCLYSSTTCQDRKCACKENFVSMDGRCTYIGPPTTLAPPATTGTDDETTTSLDNTNNPSTEGHATHTPTPPTTPTVSLGILHIVLIATVPLVIIILLIIVIIAIMYGCRRRLERRESKNLLKRKIQISAPSPVHSLDRYHRGGDSASSGFVDDPEHYQLKYGQAGKTFLGSRGVMPSSRDDIDEAAFTAEFPAQLQQRTPQPVPVAVPTLPGYQLQHIGLDYRPREAQTDVPDGDFTTDITYTTDEGGMTTSAPHSNQGSPNTVRRHAHLMTQSPAPVSSPSHIPSQSQETYVAMQSLYSQVTPRSQRRAYESHDIVESPNNSVRSYDNRSLPRDNRRGRGQGYDYMDYHSNNGHRMRSRSAPKDFRLYERERQRYYGNQYEYRSPSPGYHGNGNHGAIATGLDNSLVQAIAQMEGGRSSAAHSVRSAGGGRSGHKRRRRRYQGQPHHMTYHARHRHGNEGPSDQDLTSASEAEQSYHRHPPTRSLPVSPAHLTDTDEHDYATLPRVVPSHQHAPTPSQHHAPAPSRQHAPTPPPPNHAAGSRLAQLRGQKLREGHYDYPRIFQQSPPQSPSTSTPSPSPHLTPVTPPTAPTPVTLPMAPTPVTPPMAPTQSIPVTPPTAPTVVTPPAHLSVTPPTPQQVPTIVTPPAQTTTTNKSRRYEHLAPLKLSPGEGSPLSSRKYPPSPLALQSRSSAEVTTFFPPAPRQ